MRDGDIEAFHGGHRRRCDRLNFRGAWRTQTYIYSVRHVRGLATQDPLVQVNVSNHPGPGRILERHEKMLSRKSGETHHFVESAGFLEFLAGLILNAQQKLIKEKFLGQE